MKRILAFFTGIILSTVALATDTPIGCQGNSCSVTLYSRTSGGTATLGLKLDGTQTVTVGPSGGSQIHTSNGSMKIATGIATNFTVGSGATGASLFIYQIGNSNNQTCTTSCGATRPTGANASSGACLAAWNSSGNPSTCATAAANNFCSCLAIP